MKSIEKKDHQMNRQPHACTFPHTRPQAYTMWIKRKVKDDAKKTWSWSFWNILLKAIYSFIYKLLKPSICKVEQPIPQSQLGDKMIKNKGNNMGRANDMGVLNQGREKTWGKNTKKRTQNTKMNKCKKRPSKGVNLTCAHKWRNEKQIS
jgi:hypothetical protein